MRCLNVLLKDRELLRIVKHDATYYRGKHYEQDGRVQIKSIEQIGTLYHCTGIVQGSRLYHTQLVIDANGIIQDMQCNCDDFQAYPGACKHIVALGFHFKQMGSTIDDYIETKQSSPLKRLEALMALKPVVSKHNLILDASDLFEVGIEWQHQRLQLIIIEKERQLVWSHEWLVQWATSQKMDVEGRLYLFDEQSEALKTWIYAFNDHYRLIEDGQLDKQLCQQLGVSFLMYQKKKLTFVTTPILYTVEKNKLVEQGELLVAPFRTFIWVNDEASFLDERAYHTYTTLQSLFNNKKWVINPENMQQMYQSIYPYLVDHQYVIKNATWDKKINQPTEISFYFDVQSKQIHLKAVLQYEELKHTMNQPSHDARIHHYIESKLHNMLIAKGFLLEKDYVMDAYQGAPFVFDDLIPYLRTIGRVFVSKKFEALYIGENRSIYKPRMDIQEQHFTLTLEQLSFDPQELARLFQAMKLKQTYAMLSDGRMVNLNNKGLQKLHQMQQLLDMSPTQMTQKQVLPKYYALFMKSLFDDAMFSPLFDQLVQDIQKPSKIKPPKQIKATLRSYQMEGFQWLVSMHKVQFGCLLADDMGLGKTLQIITFLAYLYGKEGTSDSSLVVVPTSLLYNWKHEIEDFCPSLKIALIQGNKRERVSLLKTKADIYITTYGQLRNDLDAYSEHVFECVILDEAQTIKNDQSMVSKVVKKIRKRMGIALSGTPIENNAYELYSLFEFVLPHYFKNSYHFKRLLETDDIQRYIKPFILRRTKQDVLKDLPDKIETTTYVNMLPSQRKIYESFLLHTSQELDRLRNLGIEKHKIEFLSLLMKLRQIACHPGLVVEDFQDDSGKTEWLKEQLPYLVEKGHRILIFSQFRSLLDLVADVLNELGLSYFRIDGQVRARERIDLVKRYNNQEVPIFLISLKAGGTGLNLASADLVLHLDPWWNPAVMLQATDRAHRIGQKKVVQVIQLVSENSIEQQVLKLQDKKRELFNQLIQSGYNPLQSLTEQELLSLINK